MFSVMARKSMINVRLSELTHAEFKVVSSVRGGSMSTLLHQFIMKAIREEKERDPKGFDKAAEQYLAEIQAAQQNSKNKKSSPIGEWKDISDIPEIDEPELNEILRKENQSEAKKGES